MSDNFKDYLTVSIWKNPFTKGFFKYSWAIRDGYDDKTFAKGRSFTARGAIRATNTAHGKLERDTLKLNNAVKYNMYLSA